MEFAATAQLPVAATPLPSSIMAYQHYRNAKFVLGAHALKQLPPDQGMEVAFAGRSNSGKSSAINKITQQKSLARTSKTPGRTQQINLFQLDDQRFLVDLPGYGYAKVSEQIKRHWQETMARYLNQRQALRGVILTMDVRHPLTEYDRQMLEWCRHGEMPTHILLTKADKLSRGAAAKTLNAVRHQLKAMFGEYSGITVQLFSAMKGVGLDECYARLDAWFVIDGSTQERAVQD